MNILLHSCCGPCSIYPVSILKQDFDISGLFFNPNIHPYQEYKRRKNTFSAFFAEHKLPVLLMGDYGLQEYVRRVAFNEVERCKICYNWRLEETARIAAENHFSYFTTTLLYSRYQHHEELKLAGFKLAEKYSVKFFYSDFREGWQYGIDKSIEAGMYRQPYCGCIYSEQERYDKKLRNKK